MVVKHVYKLKHKRWVEDIYENVTSTIFIGFFSAPKKAKETIQKYKQFEGFKDYPDNFIIEEIELDFDDGTLMKVYWLTHSYEDEEGYDIVTDIAVYSSREKAEEDLQKVKDLDKFREHPEGFYIGSYEVDQTYWEGGFFTYQ